MSVVERHKSWDILDSTKIQSFMDCPRSYFYEYILGWRSKDPNVHLEFGKAWHLAMEQLILFGYGSDSVIEAHRLLTDHYRKYFSVEMDEVYAPKNPGYALRALAEYTQVYRNDKFTPIYTEIAGTVPIDVDKVLHFRMDSILQTEDGIKSLEHKTGSTLNRQWTDQWGLSVQTGTYNHVLYCLYPEEQVWGVEINGTFLQKKEHKFQRVPARRSKKMMQNWFANISFYVDWILAEQKSLMESCTEQDEIMLAFPMNTQSCTKYFGCKYHDYCISWANPLQHIDQVPMNMKVEWWNPAEEESKHTFHLKGEKDA